MHECHKEGLVTVMKAHFPTRYADNDAGLDKELAAATTFIQGIGVKKFAGARRFG